MQRKKIVLYNPKSVFFDMPLALLAIGSALDPEKYEVCIIDGRIEENVFQTIEKHIYDAVCFGVTSLTGSPIKDGIIISRKVKQLRPDIPIIWGGWHASLFPEQTLNDEYSIDITVQGQGEKTMQELVEALQMKGDLASIDGICFRDANGIIVKNRARNIVPMDTFSNVNYGLIDVETYFLKKGKRQLDYISSTGCHFRCTFCADPFVYERKWTAISAERMVDKLSELHQQYRFTDLNLQDETYFTFKKRVVEIAQLILDRKLNITWAATMRADQGARLTEEDFALCAASGLRRLLIGVESGSQEMMDWLKKDIKMEQVYLCAKRCKKYGISVIFPFIVGFPDESNESVRSTVDMALELNQMHPQFSTPIFYFKPYPGSAITTEITSNGYRLPETIHEWAEFDYIGASGPWVDTSKYKFFERYKFYLKLGYSKQRIVLFPLQWLARKRCEKLWFSFPVEKWVHHQLFKEQQLS